MHRFKKTIYTSIHCILYTTNTWALSLHEYDYVIQDNQIIYTNDIRIKPRQIIEGVDIGSFEKINQQYAKDQYSVYYERHKIKNANPATFSLIKNKHGSSSVFAKDRYSVFYQHNKIDDADPVTFDFIYDKHGLVSAYTKDFRHVYYKGEIVPDLDPATFSFIENGNGYIKDKKAIFRYSKKLPQLDVDSFKIISPQYVQDKNGVYFQGNETDAIDTNTYVILSDTNYCKDAHHVYYQGKKITHANPDSFQQIHPTQYGLTKDDNYVFRYGDILEDADSKSFILLADGKYSRDNKNVYYLGRHIKNADPQSFKVLDYDLAKDKTHVYRKGETTELDPATFQILGVDEDNIEVKDKNGITRLKGTWVKVYRYGNWR